MKTKHVFHYYYILITFFYIHFRLSGIAGTEVKKRIILNSSHIIWNAKNVLAMAVLSQNKMLKGKIIDGVSGLLLMN